MESRLILPTIVLSLTLLPTSQSQADLACDAEVEDIQAILDAPPPDTSDANLEQATVLLEVLSKECASGSSLDEVLPISEQIRGLLGMGDAS